MTDEGRPIPNSYWVVPGRLLAGEYPGAKVEPSARWRLRRFLDLGVFRYIDLTEPHELLSYDTWLAEEAAIRKLDVAYERLPIRDASIPGDPAQMVAILDQIDAGIAAGQCVYVHCWGGVGRTGTVVGCHLVRHGMSGEVALRELAELFSTMEKGGWRGSPETEEQADYVRNWSEPEPGQ